MSKNEITANKFRQITGVKVLKKEVVISSQTTYIYTERTPSGDLVSEEKFIKTEAGVKWNFPPHADFINAMKMLRKIVIDAFGFKGEFSNFDKYHVLGISLSGMDKDETSKVKISAQKESDNGERGTLVTRKLSLSDPDKYADCEQLDKLCKAIITEAELYEGGKREEKAQLTIPYEDGENVTMSVQKDGEPEMEAVFDPNEE